MTARQPARASPELRKAPLSPRYRRNYTTSRGTTTRRRFSDKFKATVALEALRGDRTVQQIAAKHRIHPTQVASWKRQAIDGLTGVFSDKVRKAENNEVEVKVLHARIGKLAVENDFLSQGLNAVA